LITKGWRCWVDRLGFKAGHLLYHAASPARHPVVLLNGIQSKERSLSSYFLYIGSNVFIHL